MAQPWYLGLSLLLALLLLLQWCSNEMHVRLFAQKKCAMDINHCRWTTKAVSNFKIVERYMHRYNLVHIHNVHTRPPSCLQPAHQMQLVVTERQKRYKKNLNRTRPLQKVWVVRTWLKSQIVALKLCFKRVGCAITTEKKLGKFEPRMNIPRYMCTQTHGCCSSTYQTEWTLHLSRRNAQIRSETTHSW